MRKLLLASVALTALIVSPVLAADMAVKAPPPMPAPVSTWTGCYIGGNAGWAKAQTRVTINGVDEFDRSRDGAAYGGQIGCDYQFGAPSWSAYGKSA